MPIITITLPDREDLDVNETVARVTAALVDVPDAQVTVEGAETSPETPPETPPEVE